MTLSDSLSVQSNEVYLRSTVVQFLTGLSVLCAHTGKEQHAFFRCAHDGHQCKLAYTKDYKNKPRMQNFSCVFNL